MIQHKHAHSTWRHAAAGLLVLSLSLGGLQTAQAAHTRAVTPQTVFPDGSYPAGLAYGPGQSLWTSLSGSGAIGQVSTSGTTLHPLPALNTRPGSLARGPDSAVWFVEEEGDRISRLAPDGELTQYPLDDGAYPAGIALGQDQALWFTERDAGRIGRIEPDGELTQFDLPHLDGKPMGIASAPDGALWFTEWENRLGRITLQGEITEFDLPTVAPERPVDLLFGPDGGLWIVLNTGRTIVRFDPASETFTRHLFTGTKNNSFSDLALGPDNRIWYVGTHTIGSFDPAGGVPSGMIEEDLDDPVFGSAGRSQIIAGPDNNLLFTTANTSSIFETETGGDPALRDLQMLIIYRPPLVLAAGSFTVDAEIVNWTNADATGVQVNLTLDEGIHLISADLPGGSCVDNGASVACTLPSLGAGARVPVSFVMASDRISGSPAQRTLALEAFSTEGDYFPADNRVVLFNTIQTSLEYFDDFSSGADGRWSHQTTAAPVSGLDVLGLFDNHEVTFEWEDLPFHDRVWLCFDLYVLGPWNGSQHLGPGGETLIGPDLWTSYLDDYRLLLTTFSNQPSYPQAFPGSYPKDSAPYQTSAAQVGEFDGDSSGQDARYQLCYQLAHTSPSLELLFKGLNLDPSGPEQWALDNVRIKIFYDAAYDRIYLPSVLR